MTFGSTCALQVVCARAIETVAFCLPFVGRRRQRVARIRQRHRTSTSFPRAGADPTRTAVTKPGDVSGEGRSRWRRRNGQGHRDSARVLRSAPAPRILRWTSASVSIERERVHQPRRAEPIVRIRIRSGRPTSDQAGSHAAPRPGPTRCRSASGPETDIDDDGNECSHGDSSQLAMVRARLTDPAAVILAAPVRAEEPR